MKEPFAPATTICQMLPYAMRHEFFRRVFGKQRIYGYRGIHTVEPSWVSYWERHRNENSQMSS